MARMIETTTVQSDNTQETIMLRRKEHQAIFDTTLKEIFLSHGVHLTELIAKPSTSSMVYGAIYQGEDVAVKILPLATPSLQDAISTYGAFKVESEKTAILSKRRNDCVLEVLDYGDASVPKDMPTELREFFPLSLVPFIIFERARFGGLDNAVKMMKSESNGGLITRTRLMTALHNATKGIKEAHEHGVAHRDIKPQNVLIFEPKLGKIADFGIARWRSKYEKLDIAELTPKYCSPEQAVYALTGRQEHNIGIKGDLYSWAIMVYELATGTHPFSWVLQKGKPARENQKRLLKAIALNDRRGFVPIGDISFDSIIKHCTEDVAHRIDDINIPRKHLKQFINRRIEFENDQKKVSRRVTI